MPFLSSTERRKRNSVTNRNLGPFEGPRGEGGKWRPRQHKDFALFRCGKGTVVSHPKNLFLVSENTRIWCGKIHDSLFLKLLFFHQSHICCLRVGNNGTVGVFFLSRKAAFFTHDGSATRSRRKTISSIWAGLERGCKKQEIHFFGREVGLPVPMY